MIYTADESIMVDIQLEKDKDRNLKKHRNIEFHCEFATLSRISKNQNIWRLDPLLFSYLRLI